jgi:hypothetical protein
MKMLTYLIFKNLDTSFLFSNTLETTKVRICQQVMYNQKTTGKT